MKPAWLKSSFVVSILVIALSVVPAYAADSTGVGGKPANPRQDNPRSKSIFVYNLKHGDSVDDAVLLFNSTPDTKNIDVYATDSLVSSGGAFACEQRADDLNDAGTWVKLSEEAVQLSGGAQQTVKFKLSVPKNVSVGEHNACIAIQAREPAKESGVNGVRLNFRSAIRVAVTIPGDINKRLDFESIKVTPKNNKLLVTQQLHNYGNVSLDTLIKTSINGLFGIGSQKIEGEYPILAGQSAEFNFEPNKPFWGGFYSVRSQGSYNANPNASLGDDKGLRKTVSISKMVFVAPQPIAIAIYLGLLILAASLITLYVVKKQKLKALKAVAITYRVTKHQTIRQIADLHQSDWKKIAKLNKLTPPYEITVGQTLLIPVAKANLNKSKNSRAPKA